MQKPEKTFPPLMLRERYRRTGTQSTAGKPLGIRRVVLTVLALLLASLMLSGCGSERKEAQVKEFWSEQLAALPGVKDFDALYGINPGMGSTARIRVTATEGTDPHALLVEVLRVAAAAGSAVNSNTSMSFTVAASDDGPYLDGRDVGLSQRPSMREVVAYVESLP